MAYRDECSILDQKYEIKYLGILKEVEENARIFKEIPHKTKRTLIKLGFSSTVVLVSIFV